MDEAFGLNEKVIMVTGASRGIGWAISRAAAAAGATVVVCGRDRPALEERARTLTGDGFRASVSVFDVTDEKAVVRAVSDATDQHGRLDALIANAGINHRAPLTEHSTADFARVVDTNLTAGFVLAREAAKVMRARKTGRIIMVASMMGGIARPNIPGYVASKGGLASLCRALAVELGPDGITCNAIGPGFTRTEMTAPLEADSAFRDWTIESTPLRRWAEPEEIGRIAVFLASDAASFITGHLLIADGGFSVNA